jgi:hypothetical protein
MLLRRLTHVVLLSALAAGCNQSLFDDGGGDGTPPDADPSQPPDGREGIPDADPMAPDADRVIPDDGGVRPDDGGVPPDASEGCPIPCYQDDAFEDFDALQGGANGRWRYVEVQSDNSYDDMEPAAVNGFPGFLGTGTPQPSLAYCASPDEPPCSQLSRKLALTTTAPGANHPGLLWTVPETGAYSVTANYVASSDAPAVETTLTLTRNIQSNVIDSVTAIIGTVEGQLYTEPMLTAGDVIVLSAIAETGTSVTVGVNLTITGPY